MSNPKIQQAVNFILEGWADTEELYELLSSCFVAKTLEDAPVLTEAPFTELELLQIAVELMRVDDHDFQEFVASFIRNLK